MRLKTMDDRKVKQVIVFRKDLKIKHKGKYVAQGAHASLGALLKCFKKKHIDTYQGEELNEPLGVNYSLNVLNGSYLDKWLNGIFTKICLGVDSEEEMLELYNKITTERPDIPCVLITDCGLTEFDGIPTNTCIGIGPFWSDEIDVYTKDLKLF